VTFKVTQGHRYWCHSTGHIWFPISLPLYICLSWTVSEILALIYQNFKRSPDLKCTPMLQTLTCAMPVLFTFNLQTKFEMSSFPRSRDMAWAPKWSNESRDPDHVPFRVDLTSAGWDLLPLIYKPNLKFLTTPIMKIWGSGAKCTNWGNLEHLEVTQGHPQCHIR